MSAERRKILAESRNGEIFWRQATVHGGNVKFFAEFIRLDGQPRIKVTTETGHHVGYFPRVQDISNRGLPIDLADVEVVD